MGHDAHGIHRISAQPDDKLIIFYMGKRLINFSKRKVDEECEMMRYEKEW